VSPVRVALVRYAPDYFIGFATALGEAGFDVHWIHGLRSEAAFLRRHGAADDEHSLDTNEGFAPASMPIEECRARLAALEAAVEGPRVHDIIQMDRLLRRKPTEFALRYLAHVEARVTEYLTRRRIQLVSSGRDTALQLLVMLVCRRLGIPWVVPTRARIPQQLYAFGTRHDTDGLIRVRPVDEAARQWATATLDGFLSRAMQPALKKSARGFGDVLRLLPQHARVFAAEARRARTDHGNDWTRYTLPQMVQMYLRRRANLLAYQWRPPFTAPGRTPFCLYALHTQPESSIDVVGSYFSDQVHLVRTIARSLPASHELYVKIHPTDVDGKTPAFYRSLAQIPGVRIVGHDVDSRDLLQRTSLLFALSGTIAYEAGLLGRPVITFARNYFNALPTIHYCPDPTGLTAAIAERIDAPPPPDLRERAIAFLSDLRSCCFEGEVNRTYGTSTENLRAADLATLQTAYRTLAAQLLQGTCGG